MGEIDGEGLVPGPSGSQWFESLLRELDSADSLLFASRRFESVVLALLSSEVSGEGQPAGQLEQRIFEMRSPESRLRIRFDAMLPAGVQDVPGPTAVEVRYFPGRNRKMATFRLREMLRTRALEASFVGAGALLIVQNLEVDESILSVLATETAILQSTLQDPPRLIVWGAAELLQLAQKHEALVAGGDWAGMVKVVRQALPGPAQTPVGVDLTATESKSAALRDLHEIYATEGVSLFLGAGVSMGFGLPSWSGILATLFGVALKEQMGSALSARELTHLQTLATQLNSDSPLQAGRVVQRALAQSGEKFEERLSGLLYAEAVNETEGTLLGAVADLCMATRRGSRVHSVVTYNYDDLLEETLTKRRVRALSVYEAKGAPSIDDLPVYHVHGFLPRDRSLFGSSAEAPVVFAEQQYHLLYTDPFHWTNIVQLNAIREHTCVFLGLSMTDPNLRRLLEIGSRSSESARHYAFMKRRAVKEVKREGKPAALSGTTIEQFLGWHHQLSEEVLKDLGVRVIWFDSYDEIRDAIQSLADQ
jgi:hypothetical protein